MPSITSTFEGMFGGPCPSPLCGESGQLLEHKAEYGGYRTIRHVDGSGHERLCTLPDDGGMLFTSEDGWWYGPRVDKPTVEPTSNV